MIVNKGIERHLKAILGKTSDETYQVPIIDVSTHSLTTVDYAHHEIHAGSMFSALISTADLDDNALRIQFKTPPAPTEVHMFLEAFVSGQAILTMTEAYTGGAAGGSTLTPYNRDRNSSKTTALISTHGTPTAGIITRAVRRVQEERS